MVDGVQSGGYGVLGLYAAQTPPTPEPPASRTAVAAETTAQASTLSAAATPEPAHQIGSEPVAAASSTDGSGQTLGRDYAGQGQAQARQAAVAVSLFAASQSGSASATSASSATADSGATAGRASRAYTRTAAGTSATSPRTGSMLSTAV